MTNNCKTNYSQQLTNKTSMRNLLPIILISISAIASFIIHATAPVPAIKPDIEQPINVSVMLIDPVQFTPSYTGYGTVIAKNRLTLTAQVEGKLDYLAQNVIEGGILNIDDEVFQQDSSDLQAISAQRQAEIEIARAQLALELGEQRIAEKDYQMMKKDFNEKNWQLNLELLLRKPQLTQAKAALSIANSALTIANRDLKRSKWVSDKRYLVESKLVSQGDYLAKGDEIARLIEFNQLRVPIYLPREVASRVKEGQSISLYQPDTQRTITANISHIFPELDNKIHLQKVFAEYTTNPDDTSALIIGDFVKAEFIFAAIENTLKVPLSAIDNNHIWLVSHDKTLIERPVTILFQDEFSAVIDNVVASDEQLIINKMHSPQAGLKVHVVETI